MNLQVLWRIKGKTSRKNKNPRQLWKNSGLFSCTTVEGLKRKLPFISFVYEYFLRLPV